jgi:hypothetical protein
MAESVDVVFPGIRAAFEDVRRGNSF